MSLERTPHQIFWLPILSSLMKRGGRAKTSDIYDDVERVVSLTEFDLEYLEGSVPEPRWKNQVRQAADKMRKAGLLVKSPYGTREISEDGQKYLETHR